ncbi:MAG: zinc-ribbon domain-containing protein [Clostridiales bacterium]|nr:zinc-ribbon domain-containing protein [Clostridiales bacterium]
MPICSKCGRELRDDDIFCSKCGKKIDDSEQVDEEIEKPAELEKLSLEESIALAEKLSVDYASLEKIRNDIAENEATLRKPVIQRPRYSAFRFFWPFFVYAFISFWVIYLVGGIISINLASSGGVIFSIILAFASVVVLLIYGGSRAVNMRDSLNSAAAGSEHADKRKREELSDKTASLRTDMNLLRKNLTVYDARVPSAFRKKTTMERVKGLLQTGKAADFDEAIKMLSENQRR